MLVACAITPAFNVLTSEASVPSAIQGLVDSFLIVLLVGGYLIFIRDGRLRSWFRRLGFWQDLALSTVIVLMLFLIGRAAGKVITSLDPGRFVTSFTERHLLYALPYFAILAVTVQFVVQMNRVIGANVLGYFMTGIYHRPKMEERIGEAGGPGPGRLGCAVAAARVAGRHRRYPLQRTGTQGEGCARNRLRFEESAGLITADPDPVN